MKYSNNKGLTLLELLIAVTMLVVLTGFIAPSMLKYVEKAKRVADVNTAREIKNAFERVIIIEDVSTYVNHTYTCAVMWNRTTKMPSSTDLNLKLVDRVFLELGEVPVSKTNKNYFWIVKYDMATGIVNYIYLTESPSSKELYELYPDSSKFLGKHK